MSTMKSAVPVHKHELLSEYFSYGSLASGIASALIIFLTPWCILTISDSSISYSGGLFAPQFIMNVNYLLEYVGLNDSSAIQAQIGQAKVSLVPLFLLAVFILCLQSFYVFPVITKTAPARRITGICAGILTLVFVALFLIAFSGVISQLNAAFSSVNNILGFVNGLGNLFGLNADLSIEAGTYLIRCNVPIIGTALLGIAEIMLAR